MNILYAVRAKFKQLFSPPTLVWQNPPKVHSSTARTVLSYCNIDPETDNSNLKVLDFGCGKGRYMQIFAGCIRKSNVFGCEIHPASVGYVRNLGFKCELLNLHCPCISFKDNMFDVVFSSNVIEHISNQKYHNYLDEIYRVLRPGGIFAVGAPNYPIKRLYDIWTAIKTPKYRRYYLFDDPTHCNKLSIFQVERDLNRLFENVLLNPSWIPFESNFALLREQLFRHRMRIFGYKFFGKCNKPIQIKTE